MASEIDELIKEYKKEEKATSPVWIWFEKVETNSKCKLCKSIISRKDSSTSGMTLHLKRHHGFLSKHNAWKVFEELSCLKEERLKRKRKPESTDEQASASKQVKLSHCIAQKYPKQHPRQLDITNSIAGMICVDAQPEKMVERPGFQNLIKVMDAKYTLPSRKTFSRTVIPKLKVNSKQFGKKSSCWKCNAEAWISVPLQRWRPEQQ